MPAPFGPASASRSRRSSLNETPSKSRSPANSLRRLEAMTTAMREWWHAPACLRVRLGRMAAMSEQERWRGAGTAAARGLRARGRRGGVGPSDVVDVGRRPDGGAPRQVPPLRLRRPREPGERPPDLLQGPRLAARLLALQGGGRDHATRSCSPSASSGAAWRGIRRPLLPWVDVATGSLGQGLPIAVGVALAGKRLDRLPYRVWAVCGDSEMAEGSMWEAFEHAANAEARQPHGRSSTSTGSASAARRCTAGTSTSYVRRAEACDWHAIAIDGHDVAAIDAAYAEALRVEGRPTVIVARTLKGKGVSAVENQERLAREAARTIPRRPSPSSAASATCESRCTFASAPSRTPSPPGRSSCPATSSAPRSPPARPTATRSPPSGAPTARSSRSTARSPTPRTRRDLPGRPPRPVLRDVHRRAADGRRGRRPAGARAGSRSPPPSPPS